MPGFLITNYYGDCILKDVDETAERTTGNMELDGYKVYRNTINKFLNDKLFEEDEEIAVITEGVIYNSRILIEKHSASNLFQAVKKMAMDNKETFFAEFRGSFSGAVLYKEEKKWVVFTNHIGDKPLFYYKEGNEFIISSEIIYILDNLKKRKKFLTLNEEAVMDMLTFGFMEREITYAKEIRRLLPGHYIRISKNSFEIEEYYSLTRRKIFSGGGITDKLIEEIDYRFRNAVRFEFDKDREYGYSHLTDLSGGLDSRMTMWVASEMGYSPMVHMTYCQSGYLDEIIAKEISAYWKHNLVFEPMDDYGFLYDIEQIVKMNGGLSLYCGITGGKRILEHINFDIFGIEHTGQVGDAILGASYAINNSRGMYSYKLSNMITDKVYKKYNGDNELYLVNTRGFLGMLGTHFIRKNYTEVSSPFLDVDFMELCYSIPASVRAKHRLYKKWIENKYPEATKFVWEKTGQRVNAADIQIFLHKLISRGPAKIKNILHIPVHESKYGMNPFQYWYNSDIKLQSYFNNTFNKNISNAIIPADLRNIIIQFYNNGTVLEKSQALTAVFAIGLYFDDM